MDKKRRDVQTALYGNEKGFTLVELIVVLVILAILAAILVPALLGWIDEARVKQDVLDAKNCLTATQAELTKLYAHRDKESGKHVLKDDPKAVVKNDNPNTGNCDVDATRTQFAANVLALAKDKPYILIVGCGSTKTYAAEEDRRKQYTVYLVAISF